MSTDIDDAALDEARAELLEESVRLAGCPTCDSTPWVIAEILLQSDDNWTPQTLANAIREEWDDSTADWESEQEYQAGLK